MTDAPEATKRCAKCSEWKSVDLFSKNKQHPDGFQTRCKACVRLENQGYREKNGDHIRAKQREQYQAHAEAILARKREYRKENAEAISERRRKRYAANPEKFRQELRVNRTKNAEAIRAKHQAYRVAHADDTEKRCLWCNELKPFTTFSKSEDNKDGYKTWCKECTNFVNRTLYAEGVRSRNRAYKQANKEALGEHQREYRKNNPDIYRASNQRRRTRVKTNGGVFTSYELRTMRVIQNGVCAYCQYQYHPYALTIDHVIPIRYGGRHEAANIVLACGICNRNKWSRTPEEWVDRWYL